jgi:Chaperone of endosialidase
MAVTRVKPNSIGFKEKIMKTNNLKWFLVGAFTVAASLSALAVVNIPNTFTAGQPIKAADVNANFTAVKTAIESHDHFGQEWTGASTGSGLKVTTTNNQDALLGVSTEGFGVHGKSTTGYGGYFESLAGPGLRVKTGGVGNIITTRGADDGIRFQVDKDGNGFFLGTVSSNGNLLTSDRNAKKNFSSVNSLTILEKVARLPISIWNYKTDANNLRHIGPMAQDFHATFGLNGTDEKHISSIDAQGVALAAIKGLYQQNLKLTAQLKTLEARLAKLERK